MFQASRSSILDSAPDLSRRVLSLVGIGFVCLSLMALQPADAQVGADQVVVSSFPYGSAPGPGGLWLVDNSTGAVTPVTGLGSDLTGMGSPPPTGAGCVLIGPGGELYVGEHGAPGLGIDLHVITLSGNAVASDTTYHVGTATYGFGGLISQMALLPNGQVLVGVGGIGIGPLANFDLGIVDLGSGQVQGVPTNTGQGPFLNAFCVGPDCQVAYFAVDNGGGTCNLYSVPIPNGGQATFRGTLCALISNLVLDETNNRLIASGLFGNCAGDLIEIDLATFATSTCTPTSGSLGDLNAAAPDGTGNLFVVTAIGTPPATLFRMGAPPNCPVTLLTTGPAGGWGLPSGVDSHFRSNCPPLGNSYCGPAVPNSTGLSGVVSAKGFVWVSANEFTLTADQIPPGEFGYFLTSMTPSFPVTPPGSAGRLCLGGNIGRFANNIGQGPSFSLQVNLASMPVNPPVAVLPGETWGFQAWYRDVGNTNNFTDAVAVTFN